MPAYVDPNRFEAEQRGEFGSADLKKVVHVNENFRRANFTAADTRESDFSGSTFNGAYLEKVVAYRANSTGADSIDILMALRKYASGTNPITGASTGKNLGCGNSGNSHQNAYGSPSSPL